VQHLHRLDEKVDRLLDDMRVVKKRLSSVEIAVARLRADLAGVRLDKPTSS